MDDLNYVPDNSFYPGTEDLVFIFNKYLMKIDPPFRKLNGFNPEHISAYHIAGHTLVSLFYQIIPKALIIGPTRTQSGKDLLAGKSELASPPIEIVLPDTSGIPKLRVIPKNCISDVMDDFMSVNVLSGSYSEWAIFGVYNDFQFRQDVQMSCEALPGTGEYESSVSQINKYISLTIEIIDCNWQYVVKIAEDLIRERILV